jgi:hypothetical protein
MVFTPAMRGMFGLEWNASENTLTVTPSLPAQWNEAKVSGVPMGQSHVTIEMRRNGSSLSVRLAGGGSGTIKLLSRAPQARTVNGELRIPLPAVEVGLDHGLPVAGAVTSQLKVLDQLQSARTLRLLLSAPANSRQTMFLRVNDPKIRLRTDGADISADSAQLRIEFPSGTGYVDKTVTLSW